MDKVVASQTAAFLPEKLEFFANAIRGEAAYAVFTNVSKGHLKRKFVSDIQTETSLTNIRVSQVAAKLANLGMLDRGRGKNPNTGKVENFYAKRRDIDAIKDRFIRIRNNPTSLSRLVTVRRPTIQIGEPINFFGKRRSQNRDKRPRKTMKDIVLRIAFLGTNPIADSPLRTDIEARTLVRALKSTTNGNRILVNYYPAAEWTDLLQALNEFSPNIVHFSGHGGGGGIAFDNEGIYDDGGVDINYPLLNRFLGSTQKKPDILVLNACDTAEQAEKLLDNVKAVVAMSDTIDDAAAAYFSRFLYSAIAEGQPLSLAVEQGKIALAAMKLPDAKLPTILARPEVDVSRIKYF
ncbi:CHAT domain-containing protein [Mesorhizobium sp. NPDC059025]|uniref:CHAT domain-containing protein n=1 Tax=unclassified Mesorhizobium TaxID=325217 RepID=UPI0036D0E3C8